MPLSKIVQSSVDTPVAGTGPAFSAYQSVSQTPSSGVNTKITFDTELFDTNNNFSSSRFTPTVAGYYQINSSVNYSNNQGNILLSIYKNGSEYKRGSQYTISGFCSNASSVSGIVYCNGSTDYIEIYIYQGNGSATTASQAQTFFDGVLVRTA